MPKIKPLKLMKRKTPLMAIRKKCLDCCVKQINEIKVCPVVDCPLWQFRLGLHPFTIRNKLNPFLQPNNFKGLEHKKADQVIAIIKEKKEVTEN